MQIKLYFHVFELWVKAIPIWQTLRGVTYGGFIEEPSKVNYDTLFLTYFCLFSELKEMKVSNDNEIKNTWFANGLILC